LRCEQRVYRCEPLFDPRKRLLLFVLDLHEALHGSEFGHTLGRHWFASWEGT
jgi:hypothetical protein